MRLVICACLALVPVALVLLGMAMLSRPAASQIEPVIYEEWKKLANSSQEVCAQTQARKEDGIETSEDDHFVDKCE